MGVTFRVEGLEEVSKYLRDKREDIKAAVTKSLDKSGDLLKEEIEASIQGQRSEPRSVDTGEFLHSIDKDLQTDSVAVFTDTPQGLFMEMGTSRIPERRHFRNSADRKVSEIIEIFEDTIDQEI